MDFPFALGFAAAGSGVGLALLVLARGHRETAQWALAGGLLALAAEALFAAFSLRAASGEAMAHWQTLRLLAVSLLPGFWILFSLTCARGNYRESLRKWRMPVGAAFLLPPAWALLLRDQLLAGSSYANWPGVRFLAFERPGLAIELAVLMAALVVLANLEKTFRASVGVMRWRIKFMVIGVAALFVSRIYTSSQTLLFSASYLPLQTVNATALIVACILMAWSLRRTGLFKVDIYPSETLLRHSLVTVLVGVYLVIVGGLAWLTSALGGQTALPASAFLVLLAVVFLAGVIFSDRLRQRLRIFVSRHFRRPRYDYREVWMKFTSATASIADQAQLGRALTKFISETFDLLSVTLWLVDSQRQKLVFACSTSLQEGKEEIAPLAGRELLEALRERPFPWDLERGTEQWKTELRERHPDRFIEGGSRIGIPVLGGGQPLGLIVVGDRVGGTLFTGEDLDLLKCIGDQAAASLQTIELGRRLIEARELEAFQAMSAFFVHDLKNTASTLSLMLQNFRKHFDDPAFRAEALRAISKSASRIEGLIKRLTVLRQNLELKPVEADLNRVVAAALEQFDLSRPVIRKEFQPLPTIALDPDQIQKVVTNLVLNASEAVNGSGEIRIATGRRNGCVLFSVSDNGCGMTREFIERSLFRPFQTTKKKGIGIGMFHSKMIIEAHRGKVEVESERGKGTTFRVLLPAGNGMDG